MIYIWIDEDNRQHYCNNIDDVPDKYMKSIKVIASQASSDGVSVRTDNRKYAVQEGAPSDCSARDAVDEDTKMYMMKLEELKKYEESGKDRKLPEYKELKQQIADIQKILDEKLKVDETDPDRITKPFEPDGPDTPESYQNFRFR